MTTTSIAPVNVDSLLQLACPAKEDTPFFNHCMALAKEQGLSWEAALQYTIEMRREL